MGGAPGENSQDDLNGSLPHFRSFVRGRMDRQLDSLPFEDWVAHVFDHQVREPQWYFDANAPVWAAPAALSLAHMTRLFGDPGKYLARFDDGQLNQGFWYLVSNSGSNHMFALRDSSVSLESRIRCIESFAVLFAKLFASRCSEHLSHLPAPGANPLNLACYMWWDIIPFLGAPGDASRAQLDETALLVLEQILSLDCLACRESALHGLGHWQHCYPERVREIIDRAMSHGTDWPMQLVAYARSARMGCVQ